jgi:hypothetical protein
MSKTETPSRRPDRSGLNKTLPKSVMSLDHKERREGLLSTKRAIGNAIAKYEQAKSGGLIDDRTKLSPEEEKFVQGMIQGWTLAECYRDAWPIESAELSPDQQQKRGYAISRRAHLIKRFLELSPESSAEKKHTAVRLRKLRRSVLEEIASNPKESSSQRLRAVQLLGALPDVDFTETDEAKALTSNSSPEQIEAAIRAFLAKTTKEDNDS